MELTLDRITINGFSTLREAMEKIDSNGKGLLFVTDTNNRLLGVVTDGIIRRTLLEGKGLDIEVSSVMHTSFVVKSIDDPSDVILASFTESIKIIPLINNDNVLIDFATPNKLRRIPVAKPLLDGNELLYVTDCIKSNWISSQGVYVQRFEKMMSNLHNQMSSVSVSNGTVAIQLALLALGVGPGDEVIVPDLTFAATINAVIHVGATPVIVDVQMNNWNIDYNQFLESITSKTKAVIVVHLYGMPCDINKFVSTCESLNIFLIEDCAEALGSLFEGKRIGTFGHASTFSFFGNKTITTGEGGMVLFKDSIISNKAKILRDHGMGKKRYWHDVVGYNFRMTNLQAAIGVAQLERLNEFLKRKDVISKSYQQTLRSYNYCLLQNSEYDFYHSNWLFSFLIKQPYPNDSTRDLFLSRLENYGVEGRKVFYPLHQMPIYKDYVGKREFLNSITISKLGVSLPTSPSISNNDLDYINNALNNSLNDI